VVTTPAQCKTKGKGKSWGKTKLKQNNMIQLIDLLKEIVLSEGANAGKVIFDGNKAFVGVTHDSPPKMSPETLEKVKAIGDVETQGYWFEGNGADKTAISQVFGNIDYKGSWDEKITPAEPYTYVYTLFGNVEANHRVDQVFNGKGKTIYEKILSTYKNWAHEVIKNQEGQALVDTFLKGLGGTVLEDVKQEGTKENIQKFLTSIEDDMWKGWPKGSGPAFEMAKIAVYERDKWLMKAPDGVYFTGEGHLDSLKDINSKYSIKK
jgi:hypothetical protein